MTRVFGFEILPAPFIVSHLQLGLMLHDWGAPLSATGNERVGVYLTNSSDRLGAAAGNRSRPVLVSWRTATGKGRRRTR